MTMVTQGDASPRGALSKDAPAKTAASPRREARTLREPPSVSGDAPARLPELPKQGTHERRVLDKLVKFVERVYGEEIEARVQPLSAHRNEAGFDPFGYDPEFSRYVLAWMVFLHRSYFRTEVSGIERVPTGRVILVANHSGHIPIDGMLLVTSLVMDHEPPILVRAMVEKWAQTLPFVSVLFTRTGQVLGSPENARRLLEAEHPLLVFPEGVRGISKPFADRYKLADFGPGFMRLALETRAPIVPVAVIGGEEQYPAVGNLRSLAKMLGMPVLPIIPQVFLGFPMPLPTKYRLHFGEPMLFHGDPDEDDVEIEARVEQVRAAIQSMLVSGLSARQHIFW